MALAVVKNFLAGEVLYASDLNALNTSILNNALALISPLTGNLAAGDNDITGLDELLFTSAGADATAAGRVRRNGTHLTWHNGTAVSNLDTIVGSSDTEGTTTSTSIGAFTPSVTFAVSIPNTKSIRIVGNWRKSTGASAGVRFSLLLNATTMWSTGTNLIAGGTNAIEYGTFEFLIPPRTSASYPRAILLYTSNSITGVQATDPTPDSDLPTATLTTITIYGLSVNALVTFGVNNVRVYAE